VALRFLKPIDVEGIDKDAFGTLPWLNESASAASITSEERWLLSSLSRCQFKTGAADMQFCRHMWDAAKKIEGFRMTEGQQAYLWRLGHKYRQQLSTDVNAMLEIRLERLRRARSTL
jgi:hypothetical protein